MPLAQVSRRGTRTLVWGQMRPGSGRQTYRLRVKRGGGWSWVGGNRRTNSRGFFSVSVRAGRGGAVQVWHPASQTFGVPLVVR
jgi:hypothetical protein